jgi:hypothetical protein
MEKRLRQQIESELKEEVDAIQKREVFQNYINFEHIFL